MAEAFQKLFARGEPVVMSLNVQAAMGPVVQPERSQLSLLLRHFLERFFNHETASPDGDAKTRMVQIACAAGLPGFVVGIYLWPIYHPVIVYPPHPGMAPGPPPYWLQVNHHFFFVMYSFVAMGLATVFEWDMFFPDQLDMFVLGTLPVAQWRSFAARVGAIAVLVTAFLFDANFLAPVVLPMATDPPNLGAFLAGHVLAVASAGLFAALFVLASQSVLLALVGERMFRRISLALQGLAVTAFVMLLLLFPVLTGVTPAILQRGGAFAYWFPPFWFLGIYQRVLEGSAAPEVFGRLAGIGIAATLAAAGVSGLAYPVAYLRRVRALIEGSASRSTRVRMATSLHWLLHWTCVRKPAQRAVFHFIGQTLGRVARYRIYLVMYGGVELSVVIATILRLEAAGEHVRAEISADGVRAAVGIVAFWVIAGLRTAFVSPGNQRGSWVLRVTHGNPPPFDDAMEQLGAAKIWVMLCSGAVTFFAIAVFGWIAPPELKTWQAISAELLVGAGLCVLLTDGFFIHVTSVAFTGEPARQQSNLAFTVLRFYTFFPLVLMFSVASQYWIEDSGAHFGVAAAVFAGAHLWLRKWHRAVIREHCNQPALEEGEEDFPIRLGLRY